MPPLTCFRCGRQLDDVAPGEAVPAGEGRCPRCGAYLSPDRRETERQAVRREDPLAVPGPADGTERHVAERRVADGTERRVAEWRRRPGVGTRPGSA